MGEGRDLMVPGDSNGAAPAERREALENHVAHLRGEVGELLGEIERRGRRALDLSHQLQDRPTLVIGAVVGLGTVAITAWGVAAVRDRVRVHGSMDRARLDLARAIAPPQAVRPHRRLPAPRPPRPTFTAKQLLLAGAAVGLYLKLKGRI